MFSLLSSLSLLPHTPLKPHLFHRFTEDATNADVYILSCSVALEDGLGNREVVASEEVDSAASTCLVDGVSFGEEAADPEVFSSAVYAGFDRLTGTNRIQNCYLQYYSIESYSLHSFFT